MTSTALTTSRVPPKFWLRTRKLSATTRKSRSSSNISLSSASTTKRSSPSKFARLRSRPCKKSHFQTHRDNSSLLFLSVHNQFVSGCESFGSDLRRHGKHRDVSYDHEIASKIVIIHDENNECVTKDWGWNGQIVGSHACSYSGDNWDVSLSPPKIDNVYGLCQQSYGYSVCLSTPLFYSTIF